jgi:hypothetical protein
MEDIIGKQGITEYLDSHGILWQPVKLQGKNPVKLQGKNIVPHIDDYKNLTKAEFKERQKMHSEHIVIYTDNVQQFNVEVNNYELENIPFFLSIKKQYPHYFINTSFDRTPSNFEKECKVACGSILNGTWSYALRNAYVFNSQLAPVDKPYDEYVKRLEPKEIRSLCKKVKKQSNTMDQDTLEQVLCFVFNTSVEMLSKNPEIITKSCVMGTNYETEEIMEFINDLKYCNDGIKYNECLQILNNQDNYEDEPTEFSDGIEFFKNEVVSYSEFKKLWEEKVFYCVSLKKLIYHDFDDFFLTSDLNLISSNSAIGQVPHYGDIYRYGCYDSKAKFKAHIDLWISGEKTKKQYDKYDFLPYPYKVSSKIFNFWNGFNKEVKEYTQEIKNNTIRIFKDFINHIGSNHERLPDFLTQLFANIIQNPGTKEGIVLILTGPEGTFKGTMFRLMKEIIGRQYTIETNEPEKVIGRFNNNLMKKLLCCLNEAMSYEMIEKSSKIKGLATDIEMSYEQKGQPIIEGHNFTRLWISTNENIGAKDSQGGRRNVYIETTKMTDKLRFEINGVIDDEVCTYVLFEYLKNEIKIKYDNMQQWSEARPITKKHEEIINHFTDVIYIYLSKLCTKDEYNIVHFSDFNSDYINYMSNYPKINKKTPKELGLFMTKLINASKAIERVQNTKGKKGYKIMCNKLNDYLKENKFIQQEETYAVYDDIKHKFTDDYDSDIY